MRYLYVGLCWVVFLSPFTLAMTPTTEVSSSSTTTTIPPTYPLSIIYRVDGEVVDLNQVRPGEVSCDDSSCPTHFELGTQVTLSATALSGFSLYSWEGCSDYLETTCVMEITGPTVVYVDFLAEKEKPDPKVLRVCVNSLLFVASRFGTDRERFSALSDSFQQFKIAKTIILDYLSSVGVKDATLELVPNPIELRSLAKDADKSDAYAEIVKMMAERCDVSFVPGEVWPFIVAADDTFEIGATGQNSNKKNLRSAHVYVKDVKKVKENTIASLEGLKGKTLVASYLLESFSAYYLLAQFKKMGFAHNEFFGTVKLRSGLEDMLDDVVFEDADAAVVSDSYVEEIYQRRKPGAFKSLRKLESPIYTGFPQALCVHRRSVAQKVGPFIRAIAPNNPSQNAQRSLEILAKLIRVVRLEKGIPKDVKDAFLALEKEYPWLREKSELLIWPPILGTEQK